MPRYTYIIRGLSSLDSVLRVRHGILSLQDTSKVVWMFPGILTISTAGADPQAYVATLCRRENPEVRVTAVSTGYRCVFPALWAGGLLLWLAGVLLPVPFWASLLLSALSAGAALPAIAGSAAVWTGTVKSVPVLPLIWICLSFLVGYAQEGALAALIYAAGLALFFQLALRQDQRHVPDMTDSPSSRSQRAARRFSRLYTVIVLVLGIAVSALVPLMEEQTLPVWLYRALSLLVLAQSGLWPLCVTRQLRAGRREAAEHGASLKDNRCVEVLAETGSVAFDKLGTLTEPTLYVTSLHTLPDVSADMCVGLASLLESHVQHPVARAIVEHARRVGVQQTDRAEVTDIAVVPAMGVTARMDGRMLLCGSRHLLDSYDLVAENLPEAAVYLAIDDRVIAAFDIAGPLRGDAVQAIEALKQEGIHHLTMLTGDQPTAAEKTAVQVGLSEVYAGLLPESKLSALRKLQKRYSPALFVGSGLYDIPAMTQADAGVALGSAPPEVQNAADILLTTDELATLPRAVALCRGVTTRLRWKGRVGLAVKAAAVLLVLTGLLPLWGAVLVETGLAVLSLFGTGSRR